MTDTTDDEVFIAGTKNDNNRVDVVHTTRCQSIRQSSQIQTIPRAESPNGADICYFCRHGDATIISNDGPGNLIPREKVPALRDDEVWRSVASGQRQYKTFHTDKECHHLRQSDEIRTISRANLSDNRDECRWCAGETAEYSSKTDNLAYQLKQADDPQEVLDARQQQSD